MRPVTIASAAAAPIGQRLRAARLARHLTMEHLAAATGLSKGFISRVERDQTSPSVNTLVLLCDVLDIPIGDLFTRTDATLIPLEDAPPINLGGRGADERLLSPRRDGRFQMIRSRVEPGGNGGDTLYTIGAETELVHVISGSVRLEFSDRSWELEQGDTLTFDAQEPHNWHATSAEGADLVWVLVPAAWNP
jgi:transcriptional regulator with XRE-family HTH domain